MVIQDHIEKQRKIILDADMAFATGQVERCTVVNVLKTVFENIFLNRNVCFGFEETDTYDTNEMYSLKYQLQLFADIDPESEVVDIEVKSLGFPMSEIHNTCKINPWDAPVKATINKEYTLNNNQLTNVIKKLHGIAFVNGGECIIENTSGNVSLAYYFPNGDGHCTAMFVRFKGTILNE